ncbi:MAG: tetratricopeptide repeat protein, partial [Myxococcota bacterium]|nr:tetratricopeptide repeat protein [Myxococcota bacterium]
RLSLYDEHPAVVFNLRRLQDYLLDMGEWSERERLLLHRFDTAHPSERFDLALGLAALYSEHLEASEQETQWYGEAFGLKPSIELLDTLDARFKVTGQWQVFATLLTDALSAARHDTQLVVQLHTRLSAIYQDELGDLRKAGEHLAHLVDQQGWDATVSERLRHILEGAEDWVRLASRLEIDIAHCQDDDDKFECLLQLGHLYLDKLDRPEDGVDAWFRALELRPSDKALLVRLMDGYRLTERWTDSVDVLKRLTSVETDTQRRAQYFHAIGVIQRDKLGDVTAAVRAFDQALEFDPSFMRAFQAIEEVLRADGNYERMDRYYRKMLVRALDHQLPSDLTADLAERIGEINERHLKDEDEAIKAYQLALTHGPERLHLHGKLAELDARTGRFDDAIHRLMDLIDENPLKSDPYHTLVNLYCRADRLDEAFCVCQTLRVFGKSTPEEDDLYQSVLRRRAHTQPKPMDRASWQLLIEDLEAPNVGSILSDLTPILLDSVARSERALGISGDQGQVPPEDLEMLREIGLSLNVPAPEIRPSKKVAEMSIGSLTPPVILVGGGLAKLTEAARRFLFTRHLFLIGSRNYLATTQSDHAKRVQWLTSLIGSVHQWVDSDASVTHQLPELLEVLRTLPDAERQAYQQKLLPLLDLEAYGIVEWLSGIESLACRLAFVMCDDLEVAVQQIRRNQCPVSDMAANSRILDVILFAISPMYTSIRQRMGLAIMLEDA